MVLKLFTAFIVIDRQFPPFLASPKQWRFYLELLLQYLLSEFIECVKAKNLPI